MLCIITLLKNDNAESIIKCYDTISRTDYKYCVTVVSATPFTFTINQLINNKHPMTVKYSSTNAITQILYNPEKVLEALTVTSKTKPVNWKLQHQRHQVVKLLQITGN